MKQVMVNKQTLVHNPSYPAQVGSETKNPLPTHVHGICTKDLIGLSWIFTKEDDFDIC